MPCLRYGGCIYQVLFNRATPLGVIPDTGELTVDEAYALAAILPRSWGHFVLYGGNHQVLVNGHPLNNGIKLLHHGDEISINAGKGAFVFNHSSDDKCPYCGKMRRWITH